jgi:Tol biopolymer transport system component
MNRLTFDEAEDDLPVWTPDGEKIAFASLREESGIYWKSADGAGNAERLAPMGDKILYSHTWSSDGKTLIVTSDKGSALLDIEYLSLEGDREVKPLLYEHYQEQYPRLSPDGRWIAYTSMETGQWEVYIRSFPDVNRMKRKVSTDGGGEPAWSRDGRDLFYRIANPDSYQLMVVSVKTEPRFRLGTPRILFRNMDNKRTSY